MRRVSMRRLFPRTLPLTLLLCSLFVVQTGFQPVSLVAGDNIDGFSDVDNTIFDRYWDSRLFDGTIGYDGFIKWLHNPTGMPAGLAQADFEAEIDAAFNNWDAVDDTSPENPLVPIVNLAGPATATDAFALDDQAFRLGERCDRRPLHRARILLDVRRVRRLRVVSVQTGASPERVGGGRR